MKLKTQKYNGGFALLMAVIIISIVFSAALGAYNLIVNEAILSRAAQSSQVSFYAAYSGIECARFWELKHPGFSDSVFATSTQNFLPNNSIPNFCQGQKVNPVRVGGATSPSHFKLEFFNGSCVEVNVTKTGKHSEILTDAQGQNTLCTELSSKTVQRGILDDIK